MTLKVEKKVVLAVDAFDLENVINEVYRVSPRYEVVPDMEWNNDSSYSFIVKKEELDMWDEKSLKQFQNGKASMVLPTILKDMVNQDFIQEGNYVINVCW